MTYRSPLSVEIVDCVAGHKYNRIYMILVGAQSFFRKEGDTASLANYTLDQVHSGFFGPIEETPFTPGGAVISFTRHNRMINEAEYHLNRGTFSSDMEESLEAVRHFCIGYLLANGYERDEALLEGLDQTLRLKLPNWYK